MRVSKKLPEIQYVVDVLEFHGFECESYHESDFEDDFVPIRGASVFTITDPETDENGELDQFGGIAYCSAYDQFDKSVGTAIAFKRAYKEFCSKYNREDRLSFYDAYENFLEMKA